MRYSQQTPRTVQLCKQRTLSDSVYFATLHLYSHIMPPGNLKYPELVGLSPEERQKARVKRWIQQQNADPIKKARLQKRNAENKRKNRKLKREKNNVASSQPSSVSLQPIPIPIDPVLLPQSFNDVEDVAVAETPHACDVPIMTETPSANLYLLPNNLPELDMDLASDIIGVQVPQQSETIEWSDGRTTVLPCVWEDGVNICQEDVTFVKFLAQLPPSLPNSNNVIHVQYCDWSSKPMELRELVNATLRQGKCFLLHGLPKPAPVMLDIDYLESYGMSSMRPIVAHGKSVISHCNAVSLIILKDAKERVANFTYPHTDSTIQQFIDNVNNANVIQCVLDLPFSQGGLPFFFR